MLAIVSKRFTFIPRITQLYSTFSLGVCKTDVFSKCINNRCCVCQEVYGNSLILTPPPPLAFVARVRRKLMCIGIKYIRIFLFKYHFSLIIINKLGLEKLRECSSFNTRNRF